jgi:uncharacterized protein (DUF2235 family)
MKNIICLSDGTGNGAAKKNKTNIWRLYESIDLHKDNQIVFYDDGVGSKENTFDKIMGGAFGYGLKRNVLEMYKYLCRNYSTDDKIYLFGFSRGAFTVRVLAGFIAHAGLINAKDKDETELTKQANSLFWHYICSKKHLSLSALWCAIFLRDKNLHGDIDPEIEFIGVWDTVDAYGFPIDELAILWHRFIYPLRFSDHNLSKKVKRACHAISVDDERHSFHPVLWNEENEVGNRITQIWFSGVHADVGGGYPRKSLSLVSLDWMITQVESSKNIQGIDFIEDIRVRYKNQSDWNGPQHNSRSGLGVYYRYKPRNIEHLCNCEKPRVIIKSPKIHNSVFERIKGMSQIYVPSGIPEKYDVITTKGGHKIYETDDEKSSRVSALEKVKDIIFIRRLLNLAMFIFTFTFLLFPFLVDWEEGGSCISYACFLDPLLNVIESTLPDITSRWFDALRQHPVWLILFLSFAGVFIWLRSLLWNATQHYAFLAWTKLDTNISKKSVIKKVRHWWHCCVGNILSWLFSIVLFVFILYIIFSMVSAIIFHARITQGGLCKNSKESEYPTHEVTRTLQISKACFQTSIRLKAGDKYKFKVKSGGLTDGSYNANPNGITDPLNVVMYLATPLRRHMDQPWIKLMGRVGNDGNENFPIGKGESEYMAKTSGELFLYVNDAVLGIWPEWDIFYTHEGGRNNGYIDVTVSNIRL